MSAQFDPNSLMHVETRTLGSSDVLELYLTGTPGAGADLRAGATQLYTALREEIIAQGARIVSERLFAVADAIDTVKEVRREVLGEIDDGVAPTCLTVEPGMEGRFAGVQVHAIAAPAPPDVLVCQGVHEGSKARLLDHQGTKWLFINGLNAMADVDEAEQARRMFFCTGCFLRQAGATMKSVIRTWLWLKDVCGWYDDLNAARGDFFRREGLIDEARRTVRLPASTGIGVFGANSAACTLDLVAIIGRENEIHFHEAGGDQHSAFEYGSAFSRAAVAPMPGGQTVFISGTAAIDAKGITEHVGQIDAQISDTIDHVRSLLADLRCADEHVLTALIYCKTAEVEKAFREKWSQLSWPHITMVCDVCRPELLFEIEVTAKSP